MNLERKTHLNSAKDVVWSIAAPATFKNRPNLENPGPFLVSLLLDVGISGMVIAYAFALNDLGSAIALDSIYNVGVRAVPAGARVVRKLRARSR